jgi:hypothetical protein
MAAGGTTHDADLKKLRIERAGATLWKEQAARQLLASNQTLDELGLRSGDEIIIGKAKQGSMYDTIRFGALLVSTAVGVYTLTRIF